tara:strand:+ start:138 stop:245 length:108 start_codon:yes stop_codon:yes gene_type:complete
MIREYFGVGIRVPSDPPTSSEISLPIGNEIILVKQ